MKTGCGKVEKNMIDLLEKKIPESLRKEIEHHMDDCPGCKRIAQQFNQVWSNFVDFSERHKATPSPLFWPGLLDKIQKKEKPHSPGNKLLRGLKVSFRPAAAALVFLLGIYFGYDLGNIPQTAEPLPEAIDMETAAAEEIIVDPYFQDFQDFPQGSVADFYVSLGIQQEDKTP